MDKETRNLIQRATQDARRLLEREFAEQLEALYDVLPDTGHIGSAPGAHLDAQGRFVRERIIAAIGHERSKVSSDKEAIVAYLREAAFTTLNRFAALKLMEARRIVQECVTKGDQSAGFREFVGLAPGLGDLPDRGYRLYLECLFDEIGIEVGVLFDRRHPSSLLWPRRPALLELLEILNRSDLATVWTEDETIGWIYQYYNDEAERRQMREESSAPRNSRELAVRNQFFTPRYVVEFLTDNTLGRLWYEMTKGKTHLARRCRHLVRRPNEVFLGNPNVIVCIETAAPWVREVILSANFDSLPEDPTVGELSDLGLAIDGYAEIERRGRSWDDFISTFYNPQAEAAEENGQPWNGDAFELWCALFTYQRSVLRETSFSDTDRASGDETLRNLWPALRNALQHPLADLPQEELLRQPQFIPHRPIKDPREIRLLDPACGSMHFGLYAFDLFETIYVEAYQAHVEVGTEALRDNSGCGILDEVSPNLQAFSREVPRLIVERNIHGIDIDPRATQIAGLSLWLRAQRAWHHAGVKPADRPRITRSNVVCAEPMPGEKELLREFVERQFPTGERPAFAFLLETIFDRMTLAGEAGSLLRIEEEIRTAIADTKRLWKQGPRHEQTSLFAEPGEKTGQEELRLDLSGIGDEQFWEQAEQRIYDALEAYAEQAENGSGFQRRLFADDAAQGFALIDLCRKRYDVVVMNPPFGAGSTAVDSLLAKNYGRSRSELYAAFIERGAHLNTSNGFIGAITSRTGLYLPTYSEWRTEVLLNEIKPTVVADLGSGVLDAAMVETAAYCLNKTSHQESFFFNLVEHTDKATLLAHSILKLASSSPLSNTFLVALGDLLRLPSATFAYWIPQEIRRLFNTLPRFDQQAITRRGMATLDDFRFVRLVWEIPIYQHGETSGWVNYSKGESSTRFYESIINTANWFQDGREVKAYVESKVGSASRTIQSESKYFTSGLTWVRRTHALSVRVLPVNVIFSGGAQGIFVEQSSVNILTVLGLVSSSLFDGLTKIGVGRTGDAVQFEPGMLARVPTPNLGNGGTDVQTLCDRARTGWKLRRDLDCYSETSPWFSGFSFLFQKSSSIADLYKQQRKVVEEVYQRLASVQADIDAAATRLYGFEVENERTIRKSLHLIDEETAGQQSDGRASNPKSGLIEFVASVESLAVGFAYGRFDVSGSIDERQPPEVTDPFGPLPVCPPAMLQGGDGLPLSPEAGRGLRAEGRYPLDVAWDGILVDDPEHPLDLGRRVHSALAVFWGDRADPLEHEASALLGVPTLREWFRRPAGFFDDHLKRYSKSRRQAPIYWPLSTASNSYTVWLYYHRFHKDTFYRVRELADEKLRHEERKLFTLQQEVGPNPSAKEAKSLAEQAKFVGELRELRTEVARVLPLWKPDLNDGVIINFAPFHRLISHPKWRKDVTASWEKLAVGDYDWSHLALHLWPERVIPKCATDRSLAIAHGLDETFWEPDPEKEGKYRPREVSESELGRLITERSNPAVKAALESLSAQPNRTPARRRSRA